MPKYTRNIEDTTYNSDFWLTAIREYAFNMLYKVPQYMYYGASVYFSYSYNVSVFYIENNWNEIFRQRSQTFQNDFSWYNHSIRFVHCILFCLFPVQ
jgi:hypothetical protein